MTEPRIIQNFVGYRAHLATESRAAVVQLEATLSKLGLSVAFADIENGTVQLKEDSLAGEHTILFIDSDINAVIETPYQDKLPLVPVIGIIGVEAPSRLKSLMRLGVTATLRKPLHGGSVYAALFGGVNEFRRRRALSLQIEEHEHRRRGRRYLVKAIVAIMTSTGCDEDQAYHRLRRASMRQRFSLEDYCESLIRALPGAAEPTSELQGKFSADKSQ